MITTIRNQFRQSMYRYVVLFIVFALALSMAVPLLMKNEKGAVAWIAKINGTKISYQDFAQEVAERSEWLANVRAQYGQYADFLLQAMNISTDPKALAIETLMRECLVSQCAYKLGIQLHTDYITQSINNQKYAQHNLSNIMPQFVFDASGLLNIDKLKAFLQHKGLSIGAFEDKVEQALKRLQVMRFIGTTCYVPSFDMKQEIITNQLGKTFSYLTFSFDQFLSEEKKNQLSDEDLLSFYNRENTQKNRYWVPEKRNGILWKFDSKNYGASIADGEITEYYEKNKVSKYVLDPIKVQVKQITEKQLTPGLSLEMVREELINNTSSSWSHKWELLEPFARSDKKDAFEREAFVLQNVGDISPVIETKNGKVIVQLVQRMPRTYKPLFTVKNEIKNILIEKHFKKNFVKEIKTLVSGDGAKAIELFTAQKTGKKEKVTGLIKNDTLLAKELFGLKKGEYAFFVENETGFVVQLTDIEERNLPVLDSIKDIVKDDLWHERARNAMESTLQEAKAAASQLSFKELQKQFGGSLHSTDMVKVSDSKKIQELDQKSLPARTMMSLDKVGSLLTYNGESDSGLIKLDAIEPYSENMLADAQIDVKNNLTSMRMKLQLEGVVASLHRNATIETNESILIANEEYSE